MMIGCLVAMVIVQALVWCLRGCFFMNITEKKKYQVTQGRNQFLQIILRMVYAINLKWLAGIDYL